MVDFLLHMCKGLFLFILLTSAEAFGQFNVGGQGAQQIFGAVSSLGREVVRATEYKKTKEEQEQREAEYNNRVSQADALFARGQYREAIDQYNQALNFKQDQYVRDQLARCKAELARVDREEYQLLIDKADSSYAQLNYSAAIENYTQALAKKDLQYPKDKILQVKADQERWKKIHFSGLLISDIRIDDLSSKAFSNDPYSDFLKPGKYNVMNDFLTYSSYQTLDGIAIPANVRLVIYSEPQFKGQIMMDVIGPAIINNNNKQGNRASMEVHSREFSAPLQKIFPQSVRVWSVNNMNEWIKGSMEISTF